MNLGIFGFPANGSNTADTQVPRLQAYTTAGTYTWQVPDGVRRIAVEVWGGGGGGCNDGGGNYQAGGGGGYAFNIVSVQPGEPLTIVVGAGGANQAAIAFNAGGVSSVTSPLTSFAVVSATGGTNTGTGGTGTNGAVNLTGSRGRSNSAAFTAFDRGASPRSDSCIVVGAGASGPGTGGDAASTGSGQAGAVLIYY